MSCVVLAALISELTAALPAVMKPAELVAPVTLTLETPSVVDAPKQRLQGAHGPRLLLCEELHKPSRAERDARAREGKMQAQHSRRQQRARPPDEGRARGEEAEAEEHEAREQRAVQPALHSLALPQARRPEQRA